MSGHERIDRRSVALHRAIAAKLAQDPELLEIARDNLRRWRAEAGRSTHYLEEWSRLLDRPLPELAALIVEDSERMRALRQSTPFAGVLDPKERWAIYDAFATGTHHPGGGDHR
ncbi:MAG: hypothetical protein SFV18_02630 [Bryobacteraceae bacterium]|nr:hypothetical protein [Bryobacteraceae bacterium]